MQADNRWLMLGLFKPHYAINDCHAWELAKGVPGIGIVLSNRIVDERNRNGWFRDWTDVRRRVHGIGSKRIRQLIMNGVKISPTNWVN